MPDYEMSQSLREAIEGVVKGAQPVTKVDETAVNQMAQAIKAVENIDRLEPLPGDNETQADCPTYAVNPYSERDPLLLQIIERLRAVEQGMPLPPEEDTGPPVIRPDDWVSDMMSILSRSGRATFTNPIEVSDAMAIYRHLETVITGIGMIEAELSGSRKQQLKDFERVAETLRKSLDGEIQGLRKQARDLSEALDKVRANNVSLWATLDNVSTAVAETKTLFIDPTIETRRLDAKRTGFMSGFVAALAMTVLTFGAYLLGA